MSFVYEMVGEENRELWESIGWKNQFKGKKYFYKKSYWSYDKDRDIFLVEIGGYIDLPDYWDLSYRGRIVRMEVGEIIEEDLDAEVTFRWRIRNIYIPQSIWDEKEKVLSAISEAFSIFRRHIPAEQIREIIVEILCKPTCVEGDYNGR